MILNFQNSEQNNLIYEHDSKHVYKNAVNKYKEASMKSAPAGEIIKADGVATYLHGGLLNLSDYDKQGKDNGKYDDMMKDLSLGSDMAGKRNYMTVMSNTMSEEDYKKLTEDGVDPMKTDVESTVTTLDKIKVSLAKAGVVIEGYNDDIPMDKLEEITGSEVVANELKRAFSQRGIPLSAVNVTKAVEAVNEALSIDSISDGMCDYILRNGISPTIDNLYRVKYSAGADVQRSSGYYGEDIEGYMGIQSDAPVDIDKMMARITEEIESAGLAVNDTTIEESKWIIENGIIFSKENIKSLHSLWQCYAPFDVSEVADCVSNSLEMGIDPKDTYLFDNRSLMKKAQDIVTDFGRIDIDKVANIKELEEIRARMTLEGAVRMARAGINVDTTAIKELVNTLKALEGATNQRLFGTAGEDMAVVNERAVMYKETRQAIVELPFMPVSAVGKAIAENETVTVGNIYKCGVALQKAYENATDKYEAYGTEIRGDLGDSLKKAFANNGELLKSMGLEDNSINNRAVRIITYSSIELSVSNIEEVSRKDNMLSRIIDKMTPEKTLSLIRNGDNPLNLSLEELENKLDNLYSAPDEKADDYAKFLVKLDKTNNITDEERESYIGIYRMLHQIESSDGAALGRLINTQAEINFKNLLSAARTGKVGKIDIELSESFGELLNESGYSNDITKQIMKGFVDILDNKEGSAEYTREEYNEFRQAMNVPDKILEKLVEYGEEVTPENLRTMSDIVLNDNDKSPAKVLRSINEKLRKSDDEGDNVDALDEFEKELLNFKDNFDSKETATKGYERMVAAAGNYMESLIGKSEVEEIDLRMVKGAFKMLGMSGRLSNDEYYDVPVTIEGQDVSMRLRIVSSGEQNGNVLAALNTISYGMISARFYIHEGKLNGYVAGSDKAGLKHLEESEKINKFFTDSGYVTDSIRYIYSETLNTEGILDKNVPGEKESDTVDLYRIAKTFIKAIEQ